MELREFLSHLRDVKGHGGQYMAKCPAHDDKTASLSVAAGNNGAIVLKCQAGCNTGDVLRAIGLEMRDLYPLKAAGDTQAVEYLYTSIDGTPVHKKIRYPEKRFTQAHLDKAGNWVFNMKGVQALLYRLPEVAKGIAEGREIYVVEGEKDADTLHKYGKTATCSAFGAGPGKWLAHYNGYLQGAHVCVIQDNDAVGLAFARETAQSLLPVAASVKLLDLSRIWPEIPPHGDITDYIGAMQDKAQAVRQLEKLAEDTPLFASAPKPASLPPSAGETEEKRLFHGTCYRVKDGAQPFY